jgi:hypothetical protein
MISLVALTVLQALFAASSLRDPLDIDIDLDRQMRAQGIGTVEAKRMCIAMVPNLMLGKKSCPTKTRSARDVRATG